MKIVLISPYPDIQSFGVRTLSACLKDAGHDVHLIFLPRAFTERYRDRTLDEVTEIAKGASLIGISLMTNFFDNAVQISKRLQRDLAIPVLWGGIHPTVRPAECLAHADVVCVGEGEKPIVELAGRIQNGQAYHDIAGIWLRKGHSIVANGAGSAIQDLDSIPFPDYDYATHYILDEESIHPMSETLLHKHTAGVYMTMPTRGCPFGCTYCCNNTLNQLYPHQKPHRKRSVNHIIEELKQAKDKVPGLESVKFDDDAFFLYSLEQMSEFCQAYKANVGLPLMITGATPSTLTQEKLALLVDAGLTELRMGIQSGSEGTNRLYKRRHSNQQVKNAVKMINEFQDKIPLPQYDIILDNPWETDDDLIETLIFLAELPTPYTLALYSLTFYPGTELYTKAKAEGLITDDLEDVYRKYYHGCTKTYLNRLFFLLNDHARMGSRISPKMMSWLTNRKLRQLKLSWLLYVLTRTQTAPYFLREALTDIKEGNWSRIVRYIREKI